MSLSSQLSLSITFPIIWMCPSSWCWEKWDCPRASEDNKWALIQFGVETPARVPHQQLCSVTLVSHIKATAGLLQEDWSYMLEKVLAQVCHYGSHLECHIFIYTVIFRKLCLSLTWECSLIRYLNTKPQKFIIIIENLSCVSWKKGIPNQCYLNPIFEFEFTLPRKISNITSFSSWDNLLIS